MIDLSLLQPVSWVAAAIGVCIAAFYYALNLRETTKNRRATLTNNLLQNNLYTEEGQMRFIDLFNMQWTSFDDFYKKYDSSVNPKNYAQRMALWFNFEVLGYQYKSGLLDKMTIYNVCHLPVINAWMKFKPVIDEYRKFDYGKDYYENWEYLANEMAKLKAERDPSWKGSATYFKSGEYGSVFAK